MAPATAEAIDLALRDPGWRRYAAYAHGQRPRIAHLLDLVDELLSGRDAPRVLDVGPSLQTAALRLHRPDLVVDTLGFALETVVPRAGERHVEYDLNLLYLAERWPDVGGYDLVVFAEVLEHLCTAPRAVFRALASWLVPGGLLVVQTPNALDLPARMRALRGRPPTGGIGTLPDVGVNVGHFREYTVGEVHALGAAAGLTLERSGVHEYFARPGPAGRAWTRLARRLPPSLRSGTTVVFRGPG